MFIISLQYLQLSFLQAKLDFDLCFIYLKKKTEVNDVDNANDLIIKEIFG